MGPYRPCRVPDTPRNPDPPRYFRARRISGYLAITFLAGDILEAAICQHGP